MASFIFKTASPADRIPVTTPAATPLPVSGIVSWTCSKVGTTLWSSFTLTAGQGDNAVSTSVVDLTTGTGAGLNLKVTNAGTGPTLPAKLTIQVSTDQTNWYQYGGAIVAGTTASTAYSWGGIILPKEIMYFKVSAGSNTDQNVTLNASVSNVLKQVDMTVTQAIMDVGWKDHTRPYYNRGEPSKQGLVMYVRFAERSYVVSHDACRGGEFPVWLGSPPLQMYPLVDTETVSTEGPGGWTVYRLQNGLQQKNTIYGSAKSSAGAGSLMTPSDQVRFSGDFTVLYRGQLETFSPYGGSRAYMVSLCEATGGPYPGAGWLIWYDTGNLEIRTYLNYTNTSRSTGPITLPLFTPFTLIVTRILGINSGFPRAWLNGVNITLTNTGSWNTLGVGSNYVGLNNWPYMDGNTGWVSEFRMYNRGMDDSEIALLQSSLGQQI